MNLRFSEYSAQVPRFKNQVSFRSDLSERTRTTWLLQKMGYRNFDDLFDLFFLFLFNPSEVIYRFVGQGTWSFSTCIELIRSNLLHADRLSRDF